MLLYHKKSSYWDKILGCSQGGVRGTVCPGNFELGQSESNRSLKEILILTMANPKAQAAKDNVSFSVL
jgi:hypothetical protein